MIWWWWWWWCCPVQTLVIDVWYVYVTADGLCVEISQCGCFYRGQELPPGATVQIQCQQWFVHLLRVYCCSLHRFAWFNSRLESNQNVDLKRGEIVCSSEIKKACAVQSFAILQFSRFNNAQLLTHACRDPKEHNCTQATNLKKLN